MARAVARIVGTKRASAYALLAGGMALTLTGDTTLVAASPPAGPTGWNWTSTSCLPANPCAWDDATNWLFQGNPAPSYAYPQTASDDAYLNLNAPAEIDLITVTIDGLSFTFSGSGGVGVPTVNFSPTMLPATALSCDHLTLQATKAGCIFTTAMGAMIKTID